jgi:uncharacterized protein (TIGR00255 family)
MRSMTAFARVERKYEFGVLTWELRSVNHRYLDISLRLPDELRGLEQAVRDTAAGILQRGKLDCSLRYKADQAASGEIQIDAAVVKSLMNACNQVAGLIGQQSPLKPLEVLRWPGVLKEAEKDLTPLEAAAVQLLKAALQELTATRAREGGRISELLNQRCRNIGEIVASVRRRRPQVLQAVRDKIESKLADLRVQVDRDRLEQELVILAQRMDVDEELDRLDTHLKEITAVLARDEPVGRRLDFLMQELNREANTLGSKSGDAETTQASVDLKVLIEQMREQIQNIE